MSDLQNNKTNSQSSEGRMTVMPSNYLPKPKKQLPIKTLMLIGAVVILLVVIVAVSLLFIGGDKQVPVSQIPEILDEPIAEEPVVDEQPIEDVNTEDDRVAGEVVEEFAVGVTLPVLQAFPLEKSLDTDQDGLTDVEEALFSTSTTVPDTDNDSFLDGAEIAGLYDPASPSALLEVSPQIKIARNEEQRYQLLVPNSWTASMQTPTGDEFIISPVDSEELFTISVYPNEDRLQVVQWYQEQDTSTPLSQFASFKNEAGWSGIQSKDKTLVIATFGDSGPGARAFVFVMHYEAGPVPVLQYSAVWDMMLNSLAVLEPELE